MKKIIKMIFNFYQINVAVILPLLMVTVVALGVNRIPYLNLFADLVVAVVLMINWVIILWISKMSTHSILTTGLVVLVATVPLYYLELDWFVQILANFSYIIFTSAVLFEIMNQVKPKKS